MLVRNLSTGPILAVPFRASGPPPDSLPASAETVDRFFAVTEGFIDRSSSFPDFNLGHGKIFREKGNVLLTAREDNVYIPHDPEDIHFAARAVFGVLTRTVPYRPADRKRTGLYTVRSDVFVPQGARKRARIVNHFKQRFSLGEAHVGSEIFVATEGDMKKAIDEIEAGKIEDSKLALGSL